MTEVPCGCGCGRTFEPGRKGPWKEPQKYATPECRRIANNAQRRQTFKTNPRTATQLTRDRELYMDRVFGEVAEVRLQLYGPQDHKPGIPQVQERLRKALMRDTKLLRNFQNHLIGMPIVNHLQELRRREALARTKEVEDEVWQGYRAVLVRVIRNPKLTVLDALVAEINQRETT